MANEDWDKSVDWERYLDHQDDDEEGFCEDCQHWPCGCEDMYDRYRDREFDD